MRLKLLFIIFFIASNLVTLPFYYRSEKQNFRGLVTYLNGELRDGDKIVVSDLGSIIGILHYFKAYPKDRHYRIPFLKVSENETEHSISLVSQNRTFSISHSKTYWNKYAVKGNRLWVVVGKDTAKEFNKYSAFVPKGYFDGSFLNLRKFPQDSSIYLFLWDALSPEEKRIDIPIE